MAEMRAADRSGFLGLLADLLMGAQGGLNSLGTIPQSVPLVGGQGAGDLALGGGPALVDNMSYGFSPVHGAGMAATLDPAVVDLMALLPGAGRAAGVVGDLPGVIRQAAFDAYGPAANMARRQASVAKPLPMEERNELNRGLVTGGGYGLGGERMSAEDMARLVQEMYAKFPTTPQRVIPNLYGQ